MASGGGGGTTSQPADTDTDSDSLSDTDAVDSTTAETGDTDSSDPDTTAADEESTGEPPPPPPEIDPEPDPPGLSTGLYSSCRVDDDGTLTCWGDGSCGLLADGGAAPAPPTVTGTQNTWASVSIGWDHACGIAEDRSLWCWGNGRDGKVGDGVLDDGLPSDWCRFELMPIAEGTQWARLSLGQDHSCGIQTDGTLWCWGSNEAAQIGDGAVGGNYNRIAPVQVSGSHWLEVYAGDQHTCGLDTSGAVWCWGRAGNGKLGMEGVVFSSLPVEVPGLPPMRSLATGGVSSTMCALTEDGTVWCWGRNQGGVAGLGHDEQVFMPEPVDLPEPIAEIHLSVSSACARSDEGQMWCWGSGSQGQLLDGVAEPGYSSSVPVQMPGDDWIDIAAGGIHLCGRTEAGETLCWGNNEAGQVGDGTSGFDNNRLDAVPVGPWGGGPVADDWVGGQTGSAHGCGAREDGSMWCWGSRRSGRLGNGDPTDDCSPASPSECIYTTPVAVTPTGAGNWDPPSVGFDHTCAVQDDGTLWCWGANGVGQLGQDGDTALSPVQVEAATDWLGVTTGNGATCGLRGSGSAWCWGSNSVGTLGNGSTGASQSSPTQVGVATDWSALALASDNHVCGLRGTDLWCWGRNDFGQLGLGVEGDPVATPTQVPGAWSDVAVDGLRTCAIATDGSLSCWGAIDPTTSTPTPVGTDTDWAQVSVGSSFRCARKLDGTLWCWGSNTYGQLGQGSIGDSRSTDLPVQVGTDTDWLDIAAHESTVCGRRGSTLWCWGRNFSGQQGNDTIFPSGTPREVRNDG